MAAKDLPRWRLHFHIKRNGARHPLSSIESMAPGRLHAVCRHQCRAGNWAIPVPPLARGSGCNAGADRVAFRAARLGLLGARRVRRRRVDRPMRHDAHFLRGVLHPPPSRSAGGCPPGGKDAAWQSWRQGQCSRSPSIFSGWTVSWDSRHRQTLLPGGRWNACTCGRSASSTIRICRKGILCAEISFTRSSRPAARRSSDRPQAKGAVPALSLWKTLRAGKRTRTRRPGPESGSASVMVPPQDSTISLAIASPRPLPSGPLPSTR